MNTSPEPIFKSDDEESIDLKRYFSMFISNWFWFISSIFIALTIAYGINRYSEKIYTVSSTLLIRDDQIGAINSKAESVIPGGDIFRNQQNLKNEIGILKSLTLNYMVIRELKDFNVVYVGVGRRGIVESRLYKSCPFIVNYDSLKNQIFGKKIEINIISDEEYVIAIEDSFDLKRDMNFGERFHDWGFNFTIEKRIPGDKVFDEKGSNRYYFWFEEPGALANDYRNRLTVAPIDKDASVVNLSLSGFVPEQEGDYLNKLMQVYINYGLEIKNETAWKTLKFIDDQLSVISDSLIKAEGNLERYRLANNFFDLSREGTLIQDKLKSSENAKADLEIELKYYNYLSEYVNTKNSKDSLVSPTVMGITDQVLIRLVNELSSLQNEKEKLGYNILTGKPVVEFVDRRINETREALKENIRNGVMALTKLISEEDKKIAVIEKEVKKLPTTERNLIGIQRKFDLNNTVYTYLLEKRAEAGIAKASNVSDNRIIDYASDYSTVKIKPKARANYLVALMLGLILPAGLILLLDFLNDKIIDKNDIEKRTKVPIIGYISHSDLRVPIPVIEKPGSAFSESFRSVRTSIKYFNKENETPVIAVTSTISSEGKTFISINLASIIAMLGKKVLLIGLDLRKPKINRIFNFEDSEGMSTYLSGNCNYEDVIKSTQVENLFYAPSGPIPPNPAELLEREQMKQFIEKATKEFDYIIIDTPPVAIVTDTMLITPYVDLNLFVVRQRYTSRGTLEIIERMYQQKELKNMAIILNDINLSGYYGYGIRYGYSKGYGYYYGHNYYGHKYYGKKDKAQGYYNEE